MKNPWMRSQSRVLILALAKLAASLRDTACHVLIRTLCGATDHDKGTHRGDGESRSGTYPAIRFDRSADMCTHCHLTTPRGTHDVCHACAIALRADVRRGLDAIQEYLRWSEVARWLSQEE